MQWSLTQLQDETNAAFPNYPFIYPNKKLSMCSSEERIRLWYCFKMIILTISVLTELLSVSLELDYVIDIWEWDPLNQDIYIDI